MRSTNSVRFTGGIVSIGVSVGPASVARDGLRQDNERVSVLEHVANAPLAAGIVFLATESGRTAASRRLVPASLFVPACWLVRALDARAFDPIAFALVVALAVGTVLSLSSVAKADPRFTLTDLVVGLALFVPIDLRWSDAVTPGGHGGYGFWAIALT